MSDVFIPVMVMVFEEHSYLFIDYATFVDIQSYVYNSELYCIL